MNWKFEVSKLVRIPESTVEEVKRQANIVDIISQYTELRKSGKNHFAHCPFHDDRTPSFSVDEKKQLYHCFSCKRGGDVFGFLREIEGYSFQEAVISLAEAIDYPISEKLKLQLNEGESHPAHSARQMMIRAHELAQEFYHEVLMSTRAGSDALKYLKDRGLSEETIQTFKLGYSPPQRTALKSYILSKDDYFSDDDHILKESGLFSEYMIEESGEYLDRFTDRIIFPLKNRQGDPIGFSGRIFKETDGEHQSAKYMNSPETMIFNKSESLYNLDLAKGSIRRQQEVILFEGFMDVISAYQAGVENGIASMGTSLTLGQLSQIDRYANRVVIAYDGDRAGMDATKRAVDLMEEHSAFEIEVINIPKDSDPDTFIQEKGAESFHHLVYHGRDTAMTFLMRYHRQGLNLNNEREKLQYIDLVLTELAKTNSPIERELYLNQINEEFGLSLEALNLQFSQIESSIRQQQMTDLKRKNQENKLKWRRDDIIPGAKEISRIERAEQMLMHRLVYSDDAWEYLMTHYPDFHFVHANYQLLFILYEDFRQSGHVSPDLFLSTLQDNELEGLMTEIMMLDLGDHFSEQELIDYVAMIIDIQPLEERILEAIEALNEARRTGDLQLEKKLAIEITQLNQKLKATEIQTD